MMALNENLYQTSDPFCDSFSDYAYSEHNSREHF